MTQPKPKLKFTVHDYMSTPGDKRYQLLDGEMILAPSPTDNHQRIVANLFRLLDLFVSSELLGRVRLAPLDVVLSENDVVQPDVMFVSNARSEIITEANVQGAPDLVAEVISPGTAEFDRGYKRVLYARHGVREYWLVDPETESVEVMVLGAEGLQTHGVYGSSGELSSPLMESLSLDLNELFHRA
ncbi:MAG: Uma2 family endonuclease [Chloroflexi bacterium]|nr:Uma2 family endonuclease [Chloroflexota bacterium]